jgi:long-chain fatty acid transport protein
MKIRKITLFVLANFIGLTLLADGYQVNSQSARQVGMGHLGTALKLGGESMLFNPAGLSYMNGKVDLSLGVTAIMSKVKYTNNAGTYNAKTDNPVGTPIFGYAGFKITDKLFAGISITNPAGNSLFWPDNWNGSYHVQNISLKAFSVQPTISYKISEKLSIGAGFMVNFGDFEINKGIMPVGYLSNFVNAVPAPYQSIITGSSTISPMDINLAGKASTSYGYNIGVLYSPTEKLSIGVSYRSKMTMKVENGSASVSYASTELQALLTMLGTASTTIAGAIALDGKEVHAELPIPSNLNIGIAYQLTEKLLVSAEVQCVGWKTYDSLRISFPALGSAGKMYSAKHFKNTAIYRIGGEYQCCDNLALRLGFIYDMTPVDKSYYGPETPASDKISLTAGLTYQPLKNLAIDLGFQYLNGITINGTMPNASFGAFGGDYKTSALLPAIGIRLNF